MLAGWILFLLFLSLSFGDHLCLTPADFIAGLNLRFLFWEYADCFSSILTFNNKIDILVLIDIQIFYTFRL